MSESVILEETPLPTFEEVVAAVNDDTPIPEAGEEPTEGEKALSAEPEEEQPAEAQEEEQGEHAAEDATEESAVEAEASPEPEPSVPDADSRFERIAAAERELSVRRRQQEEYERQVQAREAQIAEQMKRLQEAEEWLHALETGDPLRALEARGYSFEQLAQGVAKGSGLNPNRDLEARLAKQEQQLKAWQDQQESARRAQARQQAELGARQEIAAELSKGSPALAAMGEEGVELIWGLATQEGRAGRPVPGYDVLIKQGEERIFGLLDRLMKVEAIKGRYTGDGKKKPPAQAAHKTVSNTSAATPAKKKVDDVDVLDLPDEEAFDLLFG